MKEYRKRMVITSLVTILPMFVGLLLWNKLPDTMATHFGSDNMPNGWSSKTFAVIGLPLFLLLLHWFSVGVTLNDPKKKNIGKMMFTVVFWIIPIVSIFANGATLLYALGWKVNIGLVISIIVGFVFILLGNYLSKNRQNYTVGIKLPWTLSSEENWDKTHRMASKLWVVGGILIIANGFIRNTILLLFVLIILIVVPTAYSFFLYRKQK